MTNLNAGLLDAVRTAKEAERQAEAYYAKAARETVNPFGHRLLTQLTEFEHLHYEKLSKLERSLEEHSRFIAYAEAAPTENGVGESRSEVGSAVEKAPRSAMGILTMALEIERKAEERYTDLAERTEDPDGRQMFTRLATEERQHHRMLRDAYRSLNNRGIWDW
jgi:rubrerythrin